MYQINSLLGESFYSSVSEAAEWEPVQRFFTALLYNHPCHFQISPSSVPEITPGCYLIESQENVFIIPEILLRKLLTLLCKRNIMQLPVDQLFDVIMQSEDDFIIHYQGFPYNITDFLLKLDTRVIQSIFNHLLANRLCDAGMLYPLITEDKSGKLHGCLSRNIQNEMSGMKTKTGNYQHWLDIALYQLKANLRLIAPEIQHSGLQDFLHIYKMIFNEQVQQYIERITINRFSLTLKQMNEEARLFSLTENASLAVLIRGKYADYFNKNCSRRRLEMIKEEKRYSELFSYSDYVNEFAQFVIGGLLLEYEKRKMESDLFSDYIRSISGNKDYDRLYSRMQPLNFAVCFYPSSQKVQQYIVSKVSAQGSLYLKDFFSGNIVPLVPMNQGWVDSCRDELTKQAFILHKMQKITCREIQN